MTDFAEHQQIVAHEPPHMPEERRAHGGSGSNDLFESLYKTVCKLLVPNKLPKVVSDAKSGGYKLENIDDIGILVRSQRNRLALSQSEVSKMAHVGRRFISELESGKASLEMGKVFAVCHVVGIDMLVRTGTSLLVSRELPTENGWTPSSRRSH